jgi:ABC-type antimicrobial peptide transport system permease subunit
MRSYFKTVRTALRGLRRNLMRSLLTCLGLVIGTSSVITMTEVGQGTANAVRETIAGLGANFIQVEAGSSSSSGVHSGAGTCLTLTPEDSDAIVRECSTVRYAAPGVDCRMQVIYANRNWQPWKILGTTPEYLHVRNWTEMAEGEPFTDGDVRNMANVCVMGQTPARELFGDVSPVGKEVRVRSIPLKVVGVLTRKGANMMGLDQDDLIVAPWTTVKFRINASKLAFAELAAANPVSSALQINTLNQGYPGQTAQLYPQRSALQAADSPVLMRFAALDDIFISVNTAEEIPLAIDEISRLLRQRHRLREGQSDDFGIRNWVELSEALGKSSAVMTRTLLFVAVISLVVGGVGIMNIMLVSVTERTREIGLRMAVGARPRHILHQFLTEAVLLCVIGGTIGIAMGRGASTVITAFLRWPTMPSFTAILAATAVSVAVGVVFGFYPAWRASRLDPIEALRHE